MIVVIAFYKFFELPDYKAIRQPLFDKCRQHGLLGTVLLAEEGINGMMAGSQEDIDAILQYLHADPRLSDLEHKVSFCDEHPFKRLKIRLKRELITLGDPTIDPGKEAGTYVDPQDWNALIEATDVVLVDTRNDYEVNLGTFEGALDPRITSFRDFPAYVKKTLDPRKHRRVAMFCTGGIRCEKATSYMLREGFEEVYHLKGGILKYLEEVSVGESKWQGECYVFDDRVTVDQNMAPGTYKACHGCGRPLSEIELASEYYEAGVSCPRCYAMLTDEQRAGFRERQHQVELSKMRNEKHIGE